MYQSAANVNEAREACLYQASRASCVVGVALQLLYAVRKFIVADLTVIFM